jgi:integrase
VLKLEWRMVSFDERVSPQQAIAGTVRLPGSMTKNGPPRVFPFNQTVHDVLQAQKDEADRLKKAGTISPYVFTRNGQPLVSMIKAFKAACVKAGLPGRSERPPPQRYPQLRPPGRHGAHGNEAKRTSDAKRVPSLQHHWR